MTARAASAVAMLKEARLGAPARRRRFGELRPFEDGDILAELNALKPWAWANGGCSCAF